MYANKLDRNGAPIFAQWYDITTAVGITRPDLAHLKFIVYNYWLGPMKWTGKELLQADAPNIETSSDLYLWRPSANSFARMTDPFRLNQDLSVTAGR